MGKVDSRGTQFGIDLSGIVFVGGSVETRAAGQIVEARSRRANADHAAGAGGPNHCRSVAGAFSTPDAQIHLGTRRTRRLSRESAGAQIRNGDIPVAGCWHWACEDGAYTPGAVADPAERVATPLSNALKHSSNRVIQARSKAPSTFHSAGALQDADAGFGAGKKHLELSQISKSTR